MLVTRASAAVLVAATLALDTSVAGASPTKQECVDENELGQALRQAGKLRAARAELSMCVASSCPGPVREDCAARISEIDSAAPTVVFDVRDRAGHAVSDVALRIDGDLATTRLGADEVLFDPGAHHLTLTPRGASPSAVTLTLREGEKGHRETVVVDDPGSGRRSTRRNVGIALTAVGVASALVGGALGVVAKVTYDSALRDDCNGMASTCTPAGART